MCLSMGPMRVLQICSYTTYCIRNVCSLPILVLVCTVVGIVQVEIGVLQTYSYICCLSLYRKFKHSCSSIVKPTDELHQNTHCGGVVAFSMMQTRESDEPRSMWYSSSARMKASGVTTLSSARRDRMLPSSKVTCN